ncbi:MAG TPA: type I DNA topoisomerase [Chloroflexota bacterium]|nr:type I DNA topoisomerase [Chloroflexota bacterium]
MASKLVIVESPSKAKTIEKFLGPDFQVMASVGHVVDLPAKGLGVDTRRKFAPKYVVIPGKERILLDLRRASRNASEVFLAPDPDREGEAISAHLARALEIEHPRRAVFNEITRSAVREAIEHPREIDEHLVNAQQARRILDRLVGYKISPLLWRRVQKHTSAGRVQSVAVRLIVDREQVIRDFVPEEYWTLTADLSKLKDRRVFQAELVRRAGQGEKEKLRIGSEETMAGVLRDLEGVTYTVRGVEKRKTRSMPALPYSTSSMQQDASTRLRFSPKKTMKVAQELYEGIDLGEGRTGLITYMRTDSTRVSDEAQQAVRAYIGDTFGSKYVGPGPKAKQKAGVQGAHEAIRPTAVRRLPDSLRDTLTADQLKLYTLIWRRFVASFMAPAVFDSVRVTIQAGDYIFAATGSSINFEGYYAVWPRDEKDTTLPELAEEEQLRLHRLNPTQHFTEPPPRYTEASLVKELEELGIGRPSTYVPIITTIQQRKYVKLENRRFVPLPLGETVDRLMKQHFPEIVDVKFTAQVESGLDQVEEGEQEWTDLLSDFYRDFKQSLDKAEGEMERVERPVVEIGEDCPECGRPLVIKQGRFGEFISCSNYPECKYSRQLQTKIGVACPRCGADLVERRSRRGRVFYGCGTFPKCNYALWDRPVPEPCPECGGLVALAQRGKPRKYCTECGHEAPIEQQERELVPAR